MKQELIGSAEEERKKKQRITEQLYANVGSPYVDSKSFAAAAAGLAQLTGNCDSSSNAVMNGGPIREMHYSQSLRDSGDSICTSNNDTLHTMRSLNMMNANSSIDLSDLALRNVINEQAMLHSLRGLNNWVHQAAALRSTSSNGTMTSSGPTSAFHSTSNQPLVASFDFNHNNLSNVNKSANFGPQQHSHHTNFYGSPSNHNSDGRAFSRSNSNRSQVETHTPPGYSPLMTPANSALGKLESPNLITANERHLNSASSSMMTTHWLRHSTRYNSTNGCLSSNLNRPIEIDSPSQSSVLSDISIGVPSITMLDHPSQPSTPHRMPISDVSSDSNSSSASKSRFAQRIDRGGHLKQSVQPPLKSVTSSSLSRPTITIPGHFDQHPHYPNAHHSPGISFGNAGSTLMSGSFLPISQELTIEPSKQSRKSKSNVMTSQSSMFQVNQLSHDPLDTHHSNTLHHHQPQQPYATSNRQVKSDSDKSNLPSFNAAVAAAARCVSSDSQALKRLDQLAYPSANNSTSEQVFLYPNIRHSSMSGPSYPEFIDSPGAIDRHGELDKILGHHPQLRQEEFWDTLDQMSEELKMFAGFEEEDDPQQVPSPSIGKPTKATEKMKGDEDDEDELEDESWERAMRPIDKNAIRSLVDSFLTPNCNSSVVYRLYRIGRRVLNQYRRTGRATMIDRGQSVDHRCNIFDRSHSFAHRKVVGLNDVDSFDADKDKVEHLEYVLFCRFLRDAVAPRSFQLGAQLFLATMAAHIYRGHEAKCNAIAKSKCGETLTEEEKSILSSQVCIGQEHIRPAHDNKSFVCPIVSTYHLPTSMTQMTLPRRKRPLPMDFSSSRRISNAENHRRHKKPKRMQRKKQTLNEPNHHHGSNSNIAGHSPTPNGSHSPTLRRNRSRCSPDPDRLRPIDMPSQAEEQMVPIHSDTNPVESGDTKRCVRPLHIKCLPSSSSSGCYSNEGTPPPDSSPLLLRQLSLSSSTDEIDSPSFSSGKRFGQLGTSTHQISVRIQAEAIDLSKDSELINDHRSDGESVTADEEDDDVIDHRDDHLDEFDDHDPIDRSFDTVSDVDNGRLSQASDWKTDDEDENQDDYDDSDNEIDCFSNDDDYNDDDDKDDSDVYGDGIDDEAKALTSRKEMSYAQRMTMKGIQRNFDRFSRIRFFSAQEALRISHISEATRHIISGDVQDLERWLPDARLEGPQKLQTYGVFKFILAFRSLPAFNNFPPVDQKVLLRSCCSQLLLLRSTKHFNRERLCWEINPIWVSVALSTFCLLFASKLTSYPFVVFTSLFLFFSAKRRQHQLARIQSEVEF